MKKTLALTLVLSTLSLQAAKADCFDAYVAKVNQIGATAIPDVHKRPKVYQSILAHLGATVGGGAAGAMTGIVIALPGGCMEWDFAVTPICSALATAWMLMPVAAVNAMVYEGFDKPDSSAHDQALTTQQKEMAEIQLPFLALTELHSNHPDANVKKVFDMVSTLTPSAKMSEGQFVQILSVLNENNDFCQNGSLSDQDDMIRKLKTAVENQQISQQ
jgi:hypothetical protein